MILLVQEEIESIMLPNPREKELLGRIIDDGDRSDDYDDMIVNGWTRRICSHANMF
ncbi:unnamed protein product [Arabidopsis halleri]